MDPEPLGRLLDRLAPALVLYARQWSEAPQDVVQEAFVKLAALPVPPRDPDSWLFRVTRNGAINDGIARRRRRRREAEAASGAPPWFEPEPEGGRAAAVDPESAQAALAALPPGPREVIVAHLWGGLSFEQVADLTGTSSSAAHRLYHAGLQALRERLGVSCPTKPARPTPG